MNNELIAINKKFENIYLGLMKGKIDYSIDMASSFGGCGGHPGSHLEVIVERYKYKFEKEVTNELIKQYYNQIVAFRNMYSVKKMDEPIKELKDYMESLGIE